MAKQATANRVALAVVVTLLLAVAGYFYYQNQQSQREAAEMEAIDAAELIEGEIETDPELP